MKSIFFARHINSAVISHPRMPVKVLQTQQVIGSSKAVYEKLPSGKIRVSAVLTHTGSSLLTDIQFFPYRQYAKEQITDKVHSHSPIKPEIIQGFAEEITGVDIFPRNSNNGTHQRKKDIFGGTRKGRTGCSAAHEFGVSTFFNDKSIPHVEQSACCPGFSRLGNSVFYNNGFPKEPRSKE